jgi:hypothetical protein
MFLQDGIAKDVNSRCVRAEQPKSIVGLKLLIGETLAAGFAYIIPKVFARGGCMRKKIMALLQREITTIPVSYVQQILRVTSVDWHI